MMSSTMGEGERADRRRRARARVILLVSLVLAVGIIALTVIFKQSGHAIAPAGAIGVTLLYLAGIAVSWRGARFSDEVEMRSTHRALAWATIAYILVYPGWYFLWRGGLVPEPSHETLFLGVMVVTMLSYLWAKIRR